MSGKGQKRAGTGENMVKQGRKRLWSVSVHAGLAVILLHTPHLGQCSCLLTPCPSAGTLKEPHY